MSRSADRLDDLPDEQLALRAQRGCRLSFEQLVRRHDGRVLRFLLQRGGRADAEDAVQEAFIKAWLNLGRYKARWRFTTWLFTIASREMATLQRRRRLRPQSLQAAHGVAARAPAAVAESAPGPWAVAREVLSGEQYSVLWLCYAEGMNAREIASVLGRSSVWVRVSLLRSRRRLRDAVVAEEGVSAAQASIAPTGAAGGAA